MKQLRTVHFLKTATARVSTYLRASVSTIGQAFSRWPRWLRRTLAVLSTLIVLSIAFNATPHPMRIDGGKGVFHLDGVLRSGVLRPLDFSADLREIRAQYAEWLALGSLRVSAQAGAEGLSAWLARFAPLEVRHAGARSPAIHGTELRINASIEEVDLSKPSPDFFIHADLPYAHVSDLRILNTFISSQGALHIDGGAASIAAHVDANTGTNRAKGALVVGTESMSAHVGELRLEARIDANAHVANLDLDTGHLDVFSAVIDTKDVTVEDSNRVVSNWWSHIETHDAKLRPGHRVPVDVRWTAQLQSAAPVIAFSKRIPSLPGWVTRLLTGGELEASGRLQAGKAFIDLSDLKARTALLRIEGNFRQQGKAESGVFRVSSGPLSVGIELQNEETKLIFFGSPIAPPLAASTKQ